MSDILWMASAAVVVRISASGTLCARSWWMRPAGIASASATTSSLAGRASIKARWSRSLPTRRVSASLTRFHGVSGAIGSDSDAGEPSCTSLTVSTP